MTLLSSYYRDPGIPIGAIVQGSGLIPFDATKYLLCDGSSKANASWTDVASDLLPAYTWQTVTMPASQTWAWAEWSGTTWVAFGSASRTTHTSSDGISWSSHTNALPTTGFTSVAWNGSVFCAVAANTQAATSSDGITWVSRTLPLTAFTWRPIIWNGSTFVLASSTRPILITSPDGITWSVIWPVTNYTNNALTNLAADTGSPYRVVAGLNSHTSSSPALVTTDTINWKAVSATLGSNAANGLPVWNGQRWMLFQLNSTNSSAYMLSDDGEWWKGRHLAVPSNAVMSVTWAAAAKTLGITCLILGQSSSTAHMVGFIGPDGILASFTELGTVTLGYATTGAPSFVASDGTNFLLLCTGTTTVAYYGTYDSTHFMLPNLKHAGNYYLKAK